MKGIREELSTRLRSNETLELIREKEEQIRGLLEEGKATRGRFADSGWSLRGDHVRAESPVCPAGEKLSKQHLQHSNIIKKLRTKEKESDSQMAKQGKRIRELEEELKHLQQVGPTTLSELGMSAAAPQAFHPPMPVSPAGSGRQGGGREAAPREHQEAERDGGEAGEGAGQDAE